MKLYQVTQGSDWGNYYYQKKEKAEKKAVSMNALIEQLVDEGRNVDTRTYMVRELETED